MELTELQDLESTYCEMHKDVYGVKARWYKAESVEQARKDLTWLEAEGKRVWALEEDARARAVVNFEAIVRQVIATGAKTRETALSWIHMAEGTGGDAEFLCHAMGLPYGYFKTTAHLM